MAWDIFSSAFGSLFRNIGAAIKASLIPTIIIGLALAVFGFVAAALFGVQVDGAANTGVIILSIIGMILVVLFAFSWVAVLWHRASLLDEDPGFIPNLRGIHLPTYAGRLVLLTLIMIASLIPIALIGGILGSLFGVSVLDTGIIGLTILGTILNFIFSAVISLIWLRISATLPGIAIGDYHPIGKGWRETSEISGSLFWVACMLAAMNIAISLFSTPFAVSSGVIFVVISALTSWFTIMFGMSLITEIYRRTMHVDQVAGVFE